MLLRIILTNLINEHFLIIMKQVFLSYIFIINFIFSDNWVEYNKEFISSTSLVIMFQEDISPKLGILKVNGPDQAPSLPAPQCALT